MRGIYIGTIALLFFCMVLFPLFSMNQTVLSATPDNDVSNSSYSVSGESFRVKLSKEDKVVTLSAYDYIRGVVAAEMPAEYSLEALKAQTVAAYTLALCRKAENADKDYDITDSTTPDQAYMSDAQFKEREGSNYEKYKQKIGEAVQSVLGQVVTYNDKMALTVYHDISGGKTESAEVLWGGSYPYLKPVESVGDLLSPKYLSEKKIDSNMMKSALEGLSVSVSGDADSWFGNAECSESGTVLKIKVCGKSISGSDLRNALSLRSANFDVNFSDGNFVFSVRGHGHGVGMSQYGAQFMALQGSDYKEILKWYYNGCDIQLKTD